MGFLDFLLGILTPNLTDEQEQEIRTDIAAFYLAITELAKTYTNKREVDSFINEWRGTYSKIADFRMTESHELYPKVQRFLRDYEHLNEIIESNNSALMASEAKKYDELLSSIDGKSLDEQQRKVVLSDEDRNLVIAGAGSGKTLTIAGKVKYLCEAKKIPPEDILLIAFTRKSAEEMTERIDGRLGIPVQATTFHKLGLDIISHATGQRPDVQDNLSDFVRDYFNHQIINDPKAVENLIIYFAYHMNKPKQPDDCQSLGEVYEADKAADLETLQTKYDRAKFLSETAEERKKNKRTLKNEQVKSIDEVNIANFLFLNGIKYEYERLYPYKSDDPMKKPYRPDFYLPDYDIYIEHFGIDRNGELPWLSEMEATKYRNDMAWKRQFHRKNGTMLLETYSYYSREGRLTEELERMLNQNGVEFKETNFVDIFNTIYGSKSDMLLPEFIGFCCTFITLFKSRGFTPEELRNLHIKGKDHPNRNVWVRTELFKEIIFPILMAYNASLEAQGAIDFADMINEAAQLVTSGYNVHRYKWIIVDEYQDISVARYRLLKAILDQTGAKLLCVGDDWQSIYRFAGSDISLFTHFTQYFGSAEIMRLEQTYRNSQQLIDEAGAFVMKNPQQYTKSLRSSKSLEYPIVFMRYYDDPFSKLEKTIDKIIHDFGSDASILLLGRTYYDIEIVRESKLFKIDKSGKLEYTASPTTPISFLTVHKSKGLEADNVVILNFRNAALGFPNKIADDPLLELVLTDSDGYKYAEERRLLYVALTRTRNRVFILADGGKPSEFMVDFQQSGSVFITGRKTTSNEKLIPCPRCKTGHMTVRKNERNNNYFVGCSNFPQCDYTIRDTSIMRDTRYCPQCGGFLIKRKGKWSTFYGCSNYPLCKYTDKNVENISNQTNH